MTRAARHRRVATFALERQSLADANLDLSVRGLFSSFRVLALGIHQLD